MKNNLIAFIYIGSTSMKFKVHELKKSKMKVLENLIVPINVGKEVFGEGTISFETSKKIIEEILLFKNMVVQYKIEYIYVYGTSALREARNREFIKDKIRVLTGNELIILDEWEEKNYIFNEVVNLARENTDNKNNVFAYIGTGSFTLGFFRDKIEFIQSRKFGTQKLKETLHDTYDYSNDFFYIIEDFIGSNMKFNRAILRGQKIDTLYISGRETSIINKVIEVKNSNKRVVLNKEMFNMVFEKLKKLTPNEIMDEYPLTIEEAYIIHLIMIIVRDLLDITKAEEIILLKISLSDLIAKEIFFNLSKIDSQFRLLNTINIAYNIAGKYAYNMEHSKFVEEMSINLFDKLKNYHGFSEQERLVFRIASIVHNLETFEISESNYVHIYHFIRGIYIYGLSSKDIENVALIAFYHYTGVKEEHYRFMNDIEDDKKIYIAKMVAIMGIAEALDISYKQKFHKIDITRKKDNIIIDGYTYENAKNEEWNFDKYGEFFEEVYGMKILLNVKRVY